MASKEVIILGAGPAGLGAAFELQKNNVKDIFIIDRNSRPGGLSRTEVFANNRFDIGPHRFFTQNKEIDRLWHNILGDDFILVKRLTRIYYKNNFFNYPLKPFNVLKNLGAYESCQAILFYFYSLFKFRRKEARTFEEWVTNHFGVKLYQTFFKTYTEKVWGISCDKISADWAAQRIKGMSLIKAITKAKTRSLVEEFNYPICGAGMMYERMAEAIHNNGGKFLFNTVVKKINLNGNKIVSIIVENKEQEIEISTRTVFSSIPITKFIKQISPRVSDNILQSVKELYFRDHITVNLIIEKSDLFKDQWIYVHSPDVRMARLSNYNNFSSYMSANNSTTVVSVEYFVFQDDDIWAMPDQDIIELAKEELHYMNLVNRKWARQGFVIRETAAYPVYFIGFEKYYSTVKNFVTNISNLYCIGRGGMYKYNNQDHSIYTGLLAARNYCGADHNLWNVNIDAEYYEQK